MSLLGKVAFFSSCATAFVGTAYVVGIAYAPPPSYKVSNEQRINKFDDIAPVYESKTKKQEFYLGIGRWRRKILKEAEGRVLEVGAGTASNLGLYPPDKCLEVIFCDRSPHMVNVGKSKISHRLGYEPFEYPAYSIDTSRPAEVVKTAVQVRDKSDPNLGAPCCALRDGLLPISNQLVLSKEASKIMDDRTARIDAKRSAQLAHAEANPTEHLPASRSTTEDLYAVACYPTEKLPFPDNSFDTVVDMFGLCSFDDPVKAIVEMSRVCKPDGKILMLEHGRGSWEKMNNYLDKWAPRHASMWGCWWNRDIRRYIRLSGAEVVQREEKHFGTSHYIVLKPYKTLQELKDLEKRKPPK